MKKHRNYLFTILLLIAIHIIPANADATRFIQLMHSSITEGLNSNGNISQNSIDISLLSLITYTSIITDHEFNLQKDIPRLLTNGANVNYYFEGISPLQQAIHFNNQSVALILLEHGADANLQDKNGNTALHNAIINNTPIIEELIQAGADLNISNNDDLTPYMLAESDPVKYSLALNILRQYNADNVNPASSPEASSPVDADNDLEDIEIKEMLSILFKSLDSPLLTPDIAKGILFGITNYPEIVKGDLMTPVTKLLAIIGDRDYYSKQTKTTPLIAAIICKNEEMCKTLLQLGADPDAQSQCESTPLITAININNYKLALLLIKSGANPFKKDKSGRSPKEAAKAAGDPRLAILLQADDDTLNDFIDKNNLTEKIRKTLNYIIANPDDRILEAGATLLVTAAIHPQLIEYTDLTTAFNILINYGIDVNNRTLEGINALHAAIYSQHPDVVDILLKAGADPKFTTDDGVSPLALAVDSGNTRCIQLLLEAGADINQPDSNGITPLMLAKKTFTQEGIDFLKSYDK